VFPAEFAHVVQKGRRDDPLANGRMSGGDLDDEQAPWLRARPKSPGEEADDGDFDQQLHDATLRQVPRYRDEAKRFTIASTARSAAVRSFRGLIALWLQSARRGRILVAVTVPDHQYKRFRPMARTRSSPKTDLILEYLAANPTATTSQIVTELKAHGISESLAAKVRQKAARKGKRGPKKRPTLQTAKTTPAAPSSSATKADAIRDAARAMEKPVRPRDVIAVLMAQGINTSSAQVSTVLRGMGMRRRRRRKAAAGGSAPAAAANSASLNINDLVAAKKLVAQVGSIEKVKEALAALARLG
jgi:hypothetical protein